MSSTLTESTLACLPALYYGVLHGPAIAPGEAAAARLLSGTGRLPIAQEMVGRR